MFTKIKDLSKIAFVENSNNYSYRDVKNFSNTLENYFPKNKELVFLLCENTIGCILGYISCIIKKQVPVMLDANINNDLLLKLINTYNPRYLWLPQKMYVEGYNFLYSQFEYKLLTSKKRKYSINSEVCLLASTSGSTGSIKFIKQSYNNLEANSKSILKYLPINKKTKTITTLPLNYTFGMSIINTHFKSSSTIVLNKFSLFQKEFWKIFEDNQISILYGVPFNYEILDKINFFSKENTHLKILAQAGGKISENMQKKIARYCNQYKKKFFIMYGQAEATTRISYLPYKYASTKLGSVGVSISGGKLKIVDDSNKEIKSPNIIGNLFYKGKNVCLGYCENTADLKKNNNWHGVLNTGDLAKYDNDKFLYIVGRKKRFVKIYGMSINLDEIENILKDKFYKNAVAVTGDDQNINIFIENSKNNIEEKFINYISLKISLNKNKFNIIKVNKISRLSNGKIDYKKLAYKHTNQ